MTERGGQRIKVAVVGGGCAAMTTAFELSRPEHGNRYEITVYQQGWRLGGKGASGRGVNNRIEEHGLHLWMGFYDNAFQLMRDCYAELGRDPRTSPVADWSDAFVPAPYVGLTDPAGEGKWHHLLAHFPPMPGLPGDPHDTIPKTMVGYLTRTLALLSALIESARATAEEVADRSEGAPPRSGETLTGEALVAEVQRWLRYGQLATLTGVLQGVHLLELMMGGVPLASYELFAKVLEGVADGLKRVISRMLEKDDESGYVWEVIDLVLADIRGTIRFGLLTDPRGLDAINDYDAREWLRLCGASERSVNSTIMRGLYDLAFAYEDGDPARPRIAAGQALRGGLRMFFGYRGAVFWKMTAGMGDIVFAPIYEVLKRRGVRFEFFHRLNNVGIREPDEPDEPDGKAYVDRLSFDVQAELQDGAEYQPLIDVEGLPCWPSEPDWGQLVRGEALKAEARNFESSWDRRLETDKTLHVSEDFDFVVLGVSIGAIPGTCREILARDARWRDMVRHVKTVPTQAFQLWLKPDMGKLGWRKPPPNVSGFVEPFDTWADMTHLVPAEGWPEDPGAIAYFCNVLRMDRNLDPSDEQYPKTAARQVRANAVNFLNDDVMHLWPDAVDGSGQFRWEALMIVPDDDLEVSGVARFDAQFWSANVNPSDQYVQSLPGTLRYRISPLDNTYDNLTITGDWTSCGFNYGCVESAVMSGRLAAHALSQLPRLEDIFAYDHP